SREASELPVEVRHEKEKAQGEAQEKWCRVMSDTDTGRTPMTDGDMKRLLDYVAFVPIPVTVKATDYAYDGWLIGGGEKRHGEFRVMVEDGFGRVAVCDCNKVRVRDE